MIAPLVLVVALAAQADGAPARDEAAPAAAATVPTLRVELPAKTGRVGDALALTLAVEGAPEGSQFEFPDPTARFGDLAVASWTGEKGTRTYRLRSFVPGDHLVPKLRVTVHPPGKASAPVVLETEERLLSFEGLVPDDARDIRPEKGGLPVPGPIRWQPLAAVAGVLLVASFLMNRKRARVKRAAPAPSKVPPDIAALRALDELERQGLAARGEVKEHFYRLSAILRAYIEARFGVAAPEMTSEEFLEATAASDVLPRRHRDSLADFMRVADLAKYARFEPGPDEIASTLEAARRFVLETPAVPAPDDSAPAPKAAEPVAP